MISLSWRVDWLTSKQVISSIWSDREFVGTDALVCLPKHSRVKPSQAPQKEGMLANGMSWKDKWADRRGRLSLLWSLSPNPFSEC